MSLEPRGVAERLALALDAEDDQAVAALLDPDCVYEINERIIEGRDGIVGSYADNARWARRAFDGLVFESAVHAVDGTTVTIAFVDVLRHAGREHRHECRQSFVVGAHGLVVRIVHSDVPGQPEALARFMQDHGIDRPRPGHEQTRFDEGTA